MIIFRILLIFFCLCSTPALVFAKDEQEKDKEVPPWMENADKTGNSTYLVPKDAKVERIAGQVVVEPPNEYVARQVFEMHKRQADMEKELQTIKNELKEIREQCVLQQQNSDEKAP